MRLDIQLAALGLAESRSRAKNLIEGGFVLVNGVIVKKPSQDVSSDDTLAVTGNTNPYVSRGAFKLEGAFGKFGISAFGKTAVDIGASTGGFTEYLLLQGAEKVYAVDSGVGQLAKKLAEDSRVVSMEKYNARYLDPLDFQTSPSLAVMDVSFISQTLILPSLFRLLADDSVLVSLIKPQFEVGRANIDKGGIVKRPAMQCFAINKVLEFAEDVGFLPCGVIRSPINGGDGNAEYLACFLKGQNIDGLAVAPAFVKENRTEREAYVSCIVEGK